ncbi:MAG: sigma-70 family RNA polymerase sigma factor [Ferruginibacter sp.]
MYNDDELWEGLKQGDKDLFLALYKKYYHPLLFRGLRQVRDIPLVKDSIQQLFLYLWEKRATISSARNINAYLVSSLLRRLSTDLLISSKEVNLDPDPYSHSYDPEPNPEERLIRKDQQCHIEKLLKHRINALPNRQRELIVMRFYDDLNYEEIMEETGLSRRTVYNKIHEGLKKLRLDMALAPIHSASGS